MSIYFYLPLVTLGVIAAIMTITWSIAQTIRNYSIVDVIWAFNFAIIALMIYSMATGLEERKLLVCSLAGLWSLRLGIYLSLRVFSHIKEEEGRYKQLREEWKDNLFLKFFLFFQMQGVSNVFLAIPYFLIALNTDPEIHLLEYIGAGMWLLSIIGEAVSDFQLAAFRRKPENKGKVCDVGLWNYSRHPNYFFQFMIWVSVFVFAVSSPYGWISIVCPMSIAFLLFKVTGIPMTEEQSLKSRGDAYRHYQKTTSVFVPWFKKSV